MAKEAAVVFPVVDLLCPTKKCFLVWSATLTRKGVSAESLAREPTPHRLIGVRKTKQEAEHLAQQHGQQLC